MNGIDPRIARIKKSLSSVQRIYSIVSGKGGVGKTTIASLMALALNDLDKKVGLIDLDFFGPNCHVVLGVKNFGYKEEKGIEPFDAHGLKFVSIVPFIGDEKYVAMRGHSLSNAIIELLSIINWGKLDYLIIDMPPGMGDTLIEILRIIPTVENIVVSTSSRLSIETVSKLLEFLKANKYRMFGLIENMVVNAPKLSKLTDKFKIRYLGWLPYDNSLENALGNIEKLRQTNLYRSLKQLLNTHL